MFLFLDETRSQLRFHNHLYKHVENWKNEIKQKFSENLIFVGVHCRRGDYLRFYRRSSGANVVDHHFFDVALDIYRQRYNDVNNKVIFLAVTNDIKWMKKNLRKHKDVRYSSDYSDRHHKMSDDDIIGFDLCVLSTRKDFIDNRQINQNII